MPNPRKRALLDARTLPSDTDETTVQPGSNYDPEEGEIMEDMVSTVAALATKQPPLQDMRGNISQTQREERDKADAFAAGLAALISTDPATAEASAVMTLAAMTASAGTGAAVEQEAEAPPADDCVAGAPTAHEQGEPLDFNMGIVAARGLAAIEELQVAWLGEAAVFPTKANSGSDCLPYSKIASSSFHDTTEDLLSIRMQRDLELLAGAGDKDVSQMKTVSKSFLTQSVNSDASKIVDCMGIGVQVLSVGTYMLVAPGALGSSPPMHLSSIFDEEKGDFCMPLSPLSPLLEQGERGNVHKTPVGVGTHSQDSNMLPIFGGWTFDQSARMCRFATLSGPNSNGSCSATIWAAKEGILMVHDNPKQLVSQFFSFLARVGLVHHVCDYIMFDWMYRPYFDRPKRPVCTVSTQSGLRDLRTCGSVYIGASKQEVPQLTRFCTHYAVHDHVRFPSEAKRLAVSEFLIRSTGLYWLRVVDTIANSDVMSERVIRARRCMPLTAAAQETKNALPPFAESSRLESFLYMTRTCVQRVRGNYESGSAFQTSYFADIPIIAYTVCCLCDMRNYVLSVVLECAAGVSIKYNILFTTAPQAGGAGGKVQFSRVRCWTRVGFGKRCIHKFTSELSIKNVIHTLEQASGGCDSRQYTKFFVSMRAMSPAHSDCDSPNCQVLFSQAFTVAAGSSFKWPKPPERQACTVEQKNSWTSCVNMLPNTEYLRQIIRMSAQVIRVLHVAHCAFPPSRYSTSTTAPAQARMREMAGDVLESMVTSEAAQLLIQKKAKVLNDALLKMEGQKKEAQEARQSEAAPSSPSSAAAPVPGPLEMLRGKASVAKDEMLASLKRKHNQDSEIASKKIQRLQEEVDRYKNNSTGVDMFQWILENLQMASSSSADTIPQAIASSAAFKSMLDNNRQKVTKDIKENTNRKIVAVGNITAMEESIAKFPTLREELQPNINKLRDEISKIECELASLDAKLKRFDKYMACA